MRLYANTPAAANFLAMYVDEELGLGDITKKSSKGIYADINQEDVDQLVLDAKNSEGIELNEWSHERAMKLYPKSKIAKNYILDYIWENFGEDFKAFRNDEKGEYICMFEQQVFDLINNCNEHGISRSLFETEEGGILTIPADKLMPSETSYEDDKTNTCTISAKSSEAASFLAMYVEEELETPEAMNYDDNSATLNKADVNEIIRTAAEYNDISKEEWEVSCSLKETYKGRNVNMKNFRENASNTDRVFVAAKTAEAKDALEDAGYERSGIIFDMTAGELADILESVDIDLEELDVKDENGEPIEDVYSYVFDTDDVYDEYDDEDYADFDFDEEDDFDDDVDPEYFDFGEDDFDEEDDF